MAFEHFGVALASRWGDFLGSCCGHCGHLELLLGYIGALLGHFGTTLGLLWVRLGATVRI